MKVKNCFSTFDIILCGLFIALFTVGAYIRIPIMGVPFTLQLFFIMLAGQILKWHTAAFAVMTYIVLGVLGLPVFAGGGGIGYILTPGFGYLLGFVFCAVFIAAGNKNSSVLRQTLKNFFGVILVYLCGSVYTILITEFYLNQTINLWGILLSGIIVFIPTDICFCVVSAIVSKRVNKLLIKIKA